jgi:hypothetical protein
MDRALLAALATAESAHLSYRVADVLRVAVPDAAIEREFAYNGGGVADYEQRIIETLALIGDIPPPLVALRTRKRKKVVKSKKQASKRRKRPTTQSHAKKKKANTRTRRKSRGRK